MSKVVTLIDCDGVLADFSSMFVRVTKEIFGIQARMTDGKNWDHFDYPEVRAIKEDIWKYIKGTPGLIRGLEKFSYTDELLGTLRGIGDVICVTSLMDGGYYGVERINWLIEEAGFTRFDIMIAYRKYLIEGDIFIDDKPENVVKWADRWYSDYGSPVLWSAPGRSVPVQDDRVFCTSSIPDLLIYLKEEGKLKNA